MDRCSGDTRDISAGGVFVLTSELLPVGSIAQMEIRLAPGGIKLRTQGRVVRTEPGGFAAMAETGFRMLFHDGVRRGHLKAECESLKNGHEVHLLPN